MNKQDRGKFGMALATLIEAFAVKPEDCQPVRLRVYEDGLSDIPIPLLNAAVRKAITTRQFFPRVAELRLDAEACRLELKAANPYLPAECCNFTGWIEPVDEAGIPRAQRCPCWLQHQATLAELGVTGVTLVQAPKQIEAADYRMQAAGAD